MLYSFILLCLSGVVSCPDLLPLMEGSHESTPQGICEMMKGRVDLRPWEEVYNMFRIIWWRIMMWFGCRALAYPWTWCLLVMAWSQICHVCLDMNVYPSTAVCQCHSDGGMNWGTWPIGPYTFVPRCLTQLLLGIAKAFPGQIGYLVLPTSSGASLGILSAKHV